MKSTNILEYDALSSGEDLLADPMAWSSMRKLSSELLYHNTFADASRLDAMLAGQSGALADAIRAAIGDRSDGFVVPTHTSGAATGAPKPEENGSGATTAAVAASGNQNIDGLLSGVRWSDSSITYSDPDAVSDYQAGHPEAFSGFAQMTAQQMIAVHFALNASIYTQPLGAAGFGVEGFTNLGIDLCRQRFGGRHDPRRQHHQPRHGLCLLPEQRRLRRRCVLRPQRRHCRRPAITTGTP